MISNHARRNGSAVEINSGLRPYLLTRYPAMKGDMIPPTPSMDTIHDPWSRVIGMGESSASSLGSVEEVQTTMVPAIMNDNVATTRTKSIDSLSHGLRAFGTRTQNGARKGYLVTRHKLLSQFVLLLSPDQRPYIVNNIYIYIYIGSAKKVYTHFNERKLYVV